MLVSLLVHLDRIAGADHRVVRFEPRPVDIVAGRFTGSASLGVQRQFAEGMQPSMPRELRSSRKASEIPTSLGRRRRLACHADITK